MIVQGTISAAFLILFLPLDELNADFELTAGAPYRTGCRRFCGLEKAVLAQPLARLRIVSPVDIVLPMSDYLMPAITQLRMGSSLRGQLLEIIQKRARSSI